MKLILTSCLDRKFKDNPPSETLKVVLKTFLWQQMFILNKTEFVDFQNKNLFFKLIVLLMWRHPSASRQFVAKKPWETSRRQTWVCENTCDASVVMS